jgi:FtsZ-interacting cell division protein ZipA
METRSIAIGLVAIVAAFAAAFGMAKSGGSKTETAGAGVKAQSIKVASPAAVAGVEVGGTLPALKAERKAPAKKKKKPTSTSNTPSTSDTTAPSATPTPSTTNTQPSNPQPTNPQPTQPSTPKPTKPSNPQPEKPAQGGGEDG